MFDCSKDVISHHDEKVTLPQAERTKMRERRDANRERLKRGLKNAGKPAPREFVSQGSYAMKTMTSILSPIMTSMMVFISTKMLLMASVVARCLRYKHGSSLALHLLMLHLTDRQKFATTVYAFIM